MALADLLGRWLARADELAPYAAPAAEAFRRAAAELELELPDGNESQRMTDAAAAPPATTWQERFWIVPADTRMVVTDVADALQRPKSWVYRHTSQASGLPRLPHRKLDGELVFLAGEVREWLKLHEETIVAAPRVAPIDRARRSGRS